jgi:hypothetical protein
MISRRKLLQGIGATTILGLCRPLWASKPANHFLKPGEKLKPGEYVWEPELSPDPIRQGFRYRNLRVCSMKV